MAKRALMTLCVLIGTIGVAGFGQLEEQWQPSRNIELVVPYSAGGGSDINARAFADAVRRSGLLSQNILIVNRPGGSGAIGNAYVARRAGDPHTLVTFNSGQMMSTLSTDARVKLADLTPLGTLALDTLVLVVRADSEFETFGDFQDASLARPKTLTVGGTSRGSEDNLVFMLADEVAEDTLLYVPFDGSGDTLVALLGGHITSGIFNPSEIGAQIEAGRVRALGVFSQERLGGAFADVPTFREQGHPRAYFEMFRGYAGPSDMPAEAVAFWEEVFRHVSRSDEWRAEIERSRLIPAYMNAQESQDYWRDEEEIYIDLLTGLGLMR